MRLKTIGVATIQSPLKYLKQGFQWLVGLLVYANVLALLTHASWQDFVFLNGLIIVPVLWQVLALRLPKFTIVFDILTGATYTLAFLHGLPQGTIVGISYAWIIFTASIVIVVRYFVRLRLFLFR